MKKQNKIIMKNMTLDEYKIILQDGYNKAFDKVEKKIMDYAYILNEGDEDLIIEHEELRENGI